MTHGTILLAATAAGIAFFHTLLGPDHYLPFAVISRARHWSRSKTAVITLICGLGHVLSSVILGCIGIAFGIAVFKLEAVEALRGDVASWILLGFGFAYFIWGIHRALRSRPHTHSHEHVDEHPHEHSHSHSEGHAHIHDIKDRGHLTPWILFIIFIFGPCEPLIPILMYPAARGNMASVALVASVFSLVTLATMLFMVMACSYGLSSAPFSRMQRYSHALAGLTILGCGGMIKFLGL